MQEVMNVISTIWTLWGILILFRTCVREKYKTTNRFKQTDESVWSISA